MSRQDFFNDLINFQLRSLPAQLLCEINVKTQLRSNTTVARSSPQRNYGTIFQHSGHPNMSHLASLNNYLLNSASFKSCA